MTMTLVSTVTVASPIATMVFSSIPQTGQDLYLVISSRSDNYIAATINGVITGYSGIVLRGNGSTTLSSTDSTAHFILGNSNWTSYTTNTFANISAYFPNYSGSSNKSMSSDSVNENNATQAIAETHAGVWANTAAITSLTLTAYATTFVAGTTASLYTISTTGATGATVA